MLKQMVISMVNALSAAASLQTRFSDAYSGFIPRHICSFFLSLAEKRRKGSLCIITGLRVGSVNEDRPPQETEKRKV
jgi:hypothetical protein